MLLSGYSVQCMVAQCCSVAIVCSALIAEWLQCAVHWLLSVAECAVHWLLSVAECAVHWLLSDNSMQHSIPQVGTP